MAKVRTQADRRQHAVITDQHGRKWWTVVEKDTMRSCGPMIPKGWEPPLLFGKDPFVPPETYHRYKPDDPFDMTIDYDAWIAFVEAEHVAFAARISSAAVMLFGSQAADAVKNRNPELMNFVGKGPMPVAPIKAARAGNLYVLGLSQNMPKWAEEFFTAPATKEELFPNAEDDYPDEEPIEFVPLGEANQDFPDVEEPADREIVDAELEGILDLEEQFDRDATGGKRVNPRDQKTKEPPKEKPKAKARA